MQSNSTDLSGNRWAGSRRSLHRVRASYIAGLALTLSVSLVATTRACASQSESPKAETALPDAPQPAVPSHPITRPAAPCQAAGSAKPQTGQPPDGGNAPAEAGAQQSEQTEPCPPVPAINWFARFLNGPEVRALTPAEKARLAARNVVDPFNAITILGTAAISVGADSHSAYGPGMHGFGEYVGVSYSQDITGEFFGTFLIPSIVHQDPHYHRMPNASYPRRITHAIAQVFWTQGDNGRGMVNYANLVGFAIDDEISNLYVPGRETDFSASATRYGIGLATAPIDNFVTEFLPDVARHIHVRVVLIQRIINQVAKAGGPGAS